MRSALIVGDRPFDSPRTELPEGLITLKLRHASTDADERCGWYFRRIEVERVLDSLRIP
jgi:hypothetical protein